jgi:predicted lipoprotein
MKKVIKYLLLLIVIALVGYKSVYLKKLSSMGTEGPQKFDAGAFTTRLWNEKLPTRLDSAIELTTLIVAIQVNPEEGFRKYSNAMAIGNYRYSLVRFSGRAAVINEDDIVMQVNHTDSLLVLHMATEFIYGNAVRDASGLVDIRDFTNAMDLNNISEQLNKKVKTEVLPPFQKQVKAGDSVEVTGAIKFNKAHINFQHLEILPVRVKIL